MVVDFCLPNPNSRWSTRSSLAQKTGKATCDYSFHMAITWWGEQVWQEMEEIVNRGVNTFKHFMAYKGSLMVNDDEMYQSFLRCAELGALPLVHAENGDVVARLQQKLHERRQQRPRRPRLFAPARGRGRGHQPRHHDRRHAAGVPLYVVHVSSEDAHEAIRRARMLGRRVFGEPLIQHLLLDESEYFNPDWDHAARRVMSPPFRNKKQSGFAVGRPAARLAAGRRHRPLRLHQRTEAHGASATSPRSPTAPAASKTACPSVDPRRRYRPADDERVRRRHLDQ